MFADISANDHRHHDEAVPVATDIPLALINELLYQKKPAAEASPNFTKFTQNVRNAPRSRFVFIFTFPPFFFFIFIYFGFLFMIPYLLFVC